MDTPLYANRFKSSGQKDVDSVVYKTIVFVKLSPKGDTECLLRELADYVDANVTLPESTISNVSPSTCTNKDFVGVSKPWEFRFGGDISQSENRGYMMTGRAYQVSCCGYITAWEFQASLRAQIRQITFLTWRPMQVSSTVLTLTSQHQFWYTKDVQICDSAQKYEEKALFCPAHQKRSLTVTIKLAVQEYVFVKQGDIIGWHAPSGDVIDYKTTNEISSTYVIAHNMSNLTLGMNYTLNGQQHSGRIYAIKAILISAQPPRFINLSHRIILKCPLEANHYVTTIEVSDGSEVKYNIDGYNPWFSVDEITGEVRTISLLNGNLTSEIYIVGTSTCDVQATMILPVQCIDLPEAAEGMQERQSDVQVRSNFVNSKPVLLGLPAHVTVFENMLLAEVVHTLAFADEDGDHITLLYFSEDQMKNSVVSINATSGEVRIVACPALSQGQNVHISVNITAFDGQDISEPGLLSITIVGLNDPPRFPSDEYRFIINETQVGIYIATQDIWANLDLDPGDRLTFIITGGMGQDMIFVNSLTGETGVMDGYDIDIEGNGNNLTIFLMAIDTYGLNSTTKVIIQITDINDNSPVVENDGETFVISSDVPPGWKIGQIQASDIDSGKNSALIFSLTGSSLNDTSSFSINSRDGWIILTGVQTPENGNYFPIYVSVSDSGWPTNTVMATVHVKVIKSLNETFVQSPLLQHSTSTDESRSPAIFVLTGVLTCCIAAITILSYQLWKTRKVLRITQPEQGHDAYHEYRFQWVPRQIVEEGHETDARMLGSSLNAIPSFLRTSVSNQNFQYSPAVLSPSQESQEPCSVDQLARVQMAGVDHECVDQNNKEKNSDNAISRTAAGETPQTVNKPSAAESPKDIKEIAHIPCKSDGK